MRHRTTITAASILLAALGAVSCSDDGPVEEGAEAVEEAADEMEDAVDEVADEAEDALDGGM